MSAVLSVTRVTTYAQRRAITLEADAKQDGVLSNAERSGYSIDWWRVLAYARESPDPLPVIQHALVADLERDDFRETVDALGLNGQLIAAHSVRRHERLAGIRGDALPVVFAEPEPFTPTQAIRRWKKVLNLSDDDIRALLDNLNRFRKDAAGIRGRVAKAAMEKIAKLYGDTIAEGLAFSDFFERATEIMPDASRSLLQTEFRTTLADVYVGSLEEQIQERAATFPFMQFMALKDSRTTWWICLPMGTAGPNRTGYIAATNDPIWITWRPPVHFACRSTVSPISYLEAQRLGILAKDGRTKIAIVGNNPDRPFGDPPKFATDPFAEPGAATVRRVEPQEGFGG